MTIWSVESWTEAQWAEIPEADRPADAKPVRGGWSRIVPCEDSSPASYTVADESPPAVAELMAEVQAEPVAPPPAPVVRRPTPVWVYGNFDPQSIVAEPEPLPGTIDAQFVSMGHLTTVRLWSPEAWSALTDEERAIARAAPGREPGWWMDLYQHEQTEKDKARELEFYAKHGYVQSEDGRWGKPKPPEPQDDPTVLDRYREARRGVLVRSIRRWEVARRALAAVYDMPTPEAIANRSLSRAAESEVERDCRQLEALLGDAILRYAAGEPQAGRPCPSYDDTHRTRPAAVRYRRVIYTCVADPTDQLNGDDAECYSSPPIVVRLEDARVASLD